jgi:hypothetical protein
MPEAGAVLCMPDQKLNTSTKWGSRAALVASTALRAAELYLPRMRLLAR